MASKRVAPSAKQVIEALLKKGVAKERIAVALQTSSRQIDRYRLDGAEPHPKRRESLLKFAAVEKVRVRV
jgi:SOS response regulatory protein OraA/RecX